MSKLDINEIILQQTKDVYYIKRQSPYTTQNMKVIDI